ncbi:qa-syp4 tlg2p syntaxin 16-type [Nannochloropsis oceanica]
MATRDLTRKFVDYRTTAKIIGRNSLSPLSGYTMDSGLLEDANRDGNTGWAAARLQLPPAWVDLVDRVDALTAQLEAKMKELEALHRKRLLVGFDDSEAAKERDIDYMTQEITATFREAESILKQLGGGERSEGGTERVVTRNVQKSMAKRIQGLSIEFRKTQKHYMAQLKAQKAGAGGAPFFDFLSAEHGGAGGLLEIERKMREEGGIEGGFTPEQLAVLEEQEAVTAERDQEIQHIARSIEELSQIFKELAVLVIDQGTVLDRIDFNMEQVVEHTKEGVHQLVRAEENQKSAKATRCIVCLLCAIFVMILILIIKHR